MRLPTDLAPHEMLDVIQVLANALEDTHLVELHQPPSLALIETARAIALGRRLAAERQRPPTGACAMTASRLEKLNEALREIRQRQRVYPRLIDAGTLTQADADRRIAIMRAIADDYRDEGGLL